MDQLFIGVVCALIFLLFSCLLNIGLRRTALRRHTGHIALYAAAVFALALSAELVVNSSYEAVFGHMLWEYRILPLFGGDISLLAFFIWPIYGVHLYFFLQVLRQRLPERYNHDGAHAVIIGLDAPLFYEVTGNLLFLALAGEYYAYYLPGDLFHLTSVQVIPIYMLFIYIGLKLLRWLQDNDFERRSWLLYITGLLIVGTGYAV